MTKHEVNQEKALLEDFLKRNSFIINSENQSEDLDHKNNFSLQRLSINFRRILTYENSSYMDIIQNYSRLL